MSMAAGTRTAPARPAAVAASSDLPTVLAIVVTHNGKQWVRDCLVGLANQTYGLLDILVVDDASAGREERPTLMRIAKRHLRRRRWGYLRTPRPLGFGGAINWALGRIRTDADLLLFIHDDAALDRTSVERMVGRLLAEDDTAVVGPKVVGWDDPTRLEEIGMAADRFGYPYKGLEEGEIDLGQHDRAAEVFYVTSTCMLMRHEVFKHLRGWDAHMRAFAEDLDLCWRARLSGYTVRVEPSAKARHAIALATGQRDSPFAPARYFIRRNRLRTVTKNASGIRLLALIPQFVLLFFIEMLGFVLLRQPREIFHLARALLWNLFRLPQTLTERARVQRRRAVPDRRLRRLTVRETTRLRSYASLQVHKLEQAWGRRADVVARQSAVVRSMGDRLMGWQGAVVALALIALIVGFRNVLWSPPATVGELLPFPDRPTALWRSYLSPWQGAGLGYPGPAPPGYGLLGLVPFVTLGATGLAQKVLVLGLGVIAFIGAYKLVAELVDRPARLAAGLAYALGGVGYAGVREGRLGALVFGAAAPFALRSILRLIGWMRPPGFVRSRAIARLVLAGATSAAFVPGSLFLLAVVAAVLGAGRLFFDTAARTVRGLSSVAVGLVGAWALLLPWSASWFAAGGPLNRLTSDESWHSFAETFRGHGMGSVVLGQAPDHAALFGLALPLFGLVALLAGEGARRRLAFALWTVVVAVGLVMGATAAGALRPLVASPTEAGVLASLSFAALVGVAVGAFKLDLPRRTLGWIHAATIGVLGFGAFLLAVGSGPELWKGAWDPGATAGGDPQIIEQVTSLFDAEIQQRGQFRALWVGDAWSADDPSAIKPVGEHVLTGPRGEQLTDLFVNDSGSGSDYLADAISSVESGATDLGGHLLAAFNVDFVILEPGPRASEWLAQRDMALIRTEGDYLVLENQAGLPRAGLYDELPASVMTLERGDPKLIESASTPASARAEQEAAHEYVAEGVRGPGVVWLGESRNPEWEARIDGAELEPSSGGWGNAFQVPDSAEGRLEISYPRDGSDTLLTVVVIIAWIVVIGSAFSKPRRAARARR
jgi:GT2 family glycosyltransferase